jgi:hypothetical protein
MSTPTIAAIPPIRAIDGRPDLAACLPATSLMVGVGLATGSQRTPSQRHMPSGDKRPVDALGSVPCITDRV